MPSNAAPHARFQKLTPVLAVDAVEPCVAFWVDCLGFQQTMSVPGDDGRLVFASIEKDGIELMYQTRASVLADEAPESRATRAQDLEGHATTLFIEVEDLDAVERAVTHAPVVKARHETFYGTAEVYVREPGGTVVGFSMRVPASADATPLSAGGTGA